MDRRSASHHPCFDKKSWKENNGFGRVRNLKSVISMWILGGHVESYLRAFLSLENYFLQKSKELRMMSSCAKHVLDSTEVPSAWKTSVRSLAPPRPSRCRPYAAYAPSTGSASE